jgi:hypothetical protein
MNFGQYLRGRRSVDCCDPSLPKSIISTILPSKGGVHDQDDAKVNRNAHRTVDEASFDLTSPTNGCEEVDEEHDRTKQDIPTVQTHHLPQSFKRRARKPAIMGEG